MDAELEGLLEAVAGRRTLVIGDAILDVYLHGVTRGLCREAPAPVVAVQERQVVPGGAANTAVNVAALGGTSTLISVTGDDPAGRRLRSALADKGVSLDWLVSSLRRRTLVKRRVVVGSHTLLRLDEGTTEAATGEMEAALRQSAVAACSEVDILLVSDSGYGALTSAVSDGLAASWAPGQVAVVDARDPTRYAGLRPTAVTPNYVEAAHLLGIPVLDDEAGRLRQMSQAGSRLLDLTQARLAVVTLGAAGALMFERDRPPFRARVPARTDAEIVGAGDVFAAALALALSTSAAPAIAVEFATLAAATAAAVARSRGTAVTCREDMLGRLRQPGKVLTPSAVAERARRARRQGHRIVFTNGCFDLLHEGHVALLNEAKELGDVLIVGVNDDMSVRMLKGPGRPVVNLDGRMRLLAALSCVDHVVPFSGSTPASLIEAVHPHVFAKGGDYTPAMVPEADLLRQLGAEIRILSYLADRSTSRIIDQVRTSL